MVDLNRVTSVRLGHGWHNALRKMAPHLGIGILMVGLSCGLTGCGDGSSAGATGTVSGKVTLKDQDLKDSSVTFISSAKGAAASAPLSATGEYKIPVPLPVASYVVTVTPPPAGSPLLTPAGSPPPTSAIPAKYRDDKKTDLKFDVKAGANTANFELVP